MVMQFPGLFLLPIFDRLQYYVLFMLVIKNWKQIKPGNDASMQHQITNTYVLLPALPFPIFPIPSLAQLTPLPDILFQNNSGVHNIVEQSVIWLYCTANSVNATITWTKDGVTLVNDPAHIRIRSSSSGMSTTSSLVVDNFQTSDNGSYVCQARDGVLTTSSSTLSLTGGCGCEQPIRNTLPGKQQVGLEPGTF